MKKIGAIIRREKFAEVEEALRMLGVVPFALDSTSSTQSSGTSRDCSGLWSSDGEGRALTIEVEMIVNDSDARKVAETIVERAATAATGSGKVFVTPLDNAIDIGSRQPKRLVMPVASAA